MNEEFRRLLEMVRKGEFDGSKERETYGPIETWDVSRVTDMSFAFSSFVTGIFEIMEWPDALLETLDLSAWDTGEVTNMSGMFGNATSFRGDGIGAWNTGKVTKMAGMFQNAPSFRGDGIGAWDTGKVTDMAGMFFCAKNFRGDLQGSGIGAWNTSKVTDMTRMFFCATSFRGDGIGDWDTSKVTSMTSMFYGAKSFRGKGIGDWVISPELTSVKGMFSYTEQFNEPIRWTQPQGASPLSPPASTATPPAVIDTRGMFYEATAFEFHETLPPRGAAQDDQALHIAVHTKPWS